MSANIEKMEKLKSHLISELSRSIPEIRLLGKPEAPHIVAISLPGYKSEVIMNYLDGRGIYLSKGSACKKGRRSHVLESMGLDPEIMDAGLRVSLSYENTEQEISGFVEALTDAKKAVYPNLK
jgi:cysteine desulfurase